MIYGEGVSIQGARMIYGEGVSIAIPCGGLGLA
jgi:hypothetical protein